MPNSADYLYMVKYLAELKMHQRKSRKELSDIQLNKLKKMIIYAYNNVPFYRELFIRKNINPDNIKKIEDLQMLPIITKKEIQANYDKILANGINIDQCKLVNTTGSTGIPLRIYNDNKALLYSSALVYFGFFESGVRLNDKMVELTGIMEDCSGTIIKKNMISTFDPPEKIMKMLREYNPDILYSFPSIFKILSNSLNGELSSLKTRLIFTHGETLTDSNRELISSTFGAKVCNTYGSTEFNRLAFECSEHSGMHILTDGAVIEIVKDGQVVGPGEEGDIVVTGLYNYAMPLIRYNLGDIGILADPDERCSCGRGWPLIKSIEGRSDDFLTLPSGRLISPRTINVIENIPGIVQYRTIQTKRDTFSVQVVPNEEFSVESENEIRQQIRLGCLGEDISIEIERVNELPRERTGKLRTIISNVE